MINIAIDGPVGAGKSTVARECAKRLGIIYVDTGALYRACALFCVRNNVEISPENEAAVAALLNEKLNLSITLEEGTQHVIVNGEDVSDDIRTMEISKAASAVSALPSVRSYLLDMQRDIAANNSVIMDGVSVGRDAGVMYSFIDSDTSIDDCAQIGCPIESAPGITLIGSGLHIKKEYKITPADMVNQKYIDELEKKGGK